MTIYSQHKLRDILKIIKIEKKTVLLQPLIYALKTNLLISSLFRLYNVT